MNFENLCLKKKQQKPSDIMSERIAVETLTLNEISDLFRQSLEIAHPRAKGAISHKMKKLIKAKVSNHKWVQTYEIFKGAKFNFYCQKIPTESSPIVSIGMTHGTLNGLILIVLDVSNGGMPQPGVRSAHWNQWVNIYTAHYCERYAERIMKFDAPTFTAGSEGIMLADTSGVVRVTENIDEGVDEIEFQFKDGQSYGYRDSRNKITYFKTVYSNEMLKGDRRDFRGEWKETVDKLYELFKRDS